MRGFPRNFRSITLLACVVLAVLALPAARGGVLNPLDFASNGTVNSSDAVTIDVNANTMTVGATVYNGVVASDGSLVFAFDSVNLSGTFSVAGNARPFQILSHTDLTINSTIDLSGSGRTSTVSSGGVGGTQNNNGSGTPTGLAGGFGSSGTGGGGGGFGGVGGNGEGSNGAAGQSITYAEFADGGALLRTGGGGGGGHSQNIVSGASANGGNGGSAGGIAGFGAVNSVMLNGSFLANGANGSNGQSNTSNPFGSARGGGGGGGAGGGFLVYGASVDVSGASFQATGGDGGSAGSTNNKDGGSGGGGIVYIESNAGSVGGTGGVDVSRGATNAGTDAGNGVFRYEQVVDRNINTLWLNSGQSIHSRIYALWNLNPGGTLINDDSGAYQGLRFAGGTFVSPDVIDNTVVSGGILGHGAAVGRVGGANAVTVHATGGDLTIGDSTSAGGVALNGSSSLTVDGVLVTLLDANGAVIDGTATLAAGSRIASPNGTTLGGTLNATGNATVGDAFTNDGTVNGPTGGDTLIFTGPVDGDGSFTGNTTFAGGLNVGHSPAAVNFDNVTLDELNVTTIELGGTTPGSEHDQLIVSGTLSAGGTLQIVLIDDFMPEIGDVFLVFDAFGFEGGFDEILLPELDDPQAAWDTSSLLTNGTLSVAPVPEPATLALLALGGLTLAGTARRRRR